MAYGIRWQFGLAGDGKEYLLDFYILKNAPSDNPKRWFSFQNYENVRRARPLLSRGRRS
jgi:hypothetical protein